MVKEEEEIESLYKVSMRTLIILVENRPVLWDTTLDIHKDQVAISSAWREICQTIMQCFEEMDESKKQKCESIVSYRWMKAKYAWIKHKNLYKYYKEMIFLNKVIDFGEGCHGSKSNVSNIESGTQNANHTENVKEGTIASASCYNPCSYKRKLDRDKEEKCKITCLRENSTLSTKQETEERHMLFFKSLMPSLMTLNDDQTLDFHSAVLILLRNVKRKSLNHGWTYRGYRNCSRKSTENNRKSPSVASVSSQNSE